MSRLRRWVFWCLALSMTLTPAAGRAADGAKPGKSDRPQPIEIAELKRSQPVSFEKELLPVLSKKCVSCHNATTHENQLVLESPAAILKGGESGAAVVPGDPAKSLMLAAASRRGDYPMPPVDNDVDAHPMSPQELGLLKLWIQQGATGSVSDKGSAVHWQPLPPGVNPIYAVAITEDGQFAAASRANQIFLYHLPSARLVTRLTDPALAGDLRQRGAAHVEMVHSLAFSPDGARLASGGFREIKFWRAPDQAPGYSLPLGAGAVTALAASRDGRWIATGYASGQLKLWEADSGRPARTLIAEPAAAEITAIEFFGDSQRVAAGSTDKRLRVWSLADGSLTQSKELPHPIATLAVMSDAARIAAAGADKTIHVWKLAGDEVASLDSGPAPVTALAAAPNNGAMLFSGHADHAIRQWNLDAKKQTRQMDQGGPVTGLAVRGDGAQLASAGANNVIKLWKVDKGTAYPGPNNQPIAPLTGDYATVLAAGRLERRVAAGAAKVAEAKQAVAEAETLVRTTTEAIKAANKSRDTTAKLKAEKAEAAKAPVAKKADADRAVETAAAELKSVEEQLAQAKSAAEKDAENNELAKQRDGLKKQSEQAANNLKNAENVARDLAPATAKATQESLSADAAAAAADKTAQAAVVENQKAIDALPPAIAAREAAERALAAAQSALDAARRAVENAKQPIRAVAYSADGRTLLTAGDHPVVSIWESASGAPVGTRSLGAEAGAGNSISRVAMAGGFFLAASDRAVIAWPEAQDWKLERVVGSPDNASLLADRVLAIAFSPDGKLLASGGGEPTRNGELKLWNVSNGALNRTISPAHSDTVFAVEFSPDGKFLASAGADRMMKVFDVATGALRHNYDGHTHHVLGVAWRSDGKLLTTVGADNSIKFWDFATGEQTRPTNIGAKELSAVRFVGLTNKALVASADHSLRLYDSAGTGGSERTFSGPRDFVYALAVSGDGKTVVAGGQDSVLWQWNSENAQLAQKFDPPAVEPAAQK